MAQSSKPHRAYRQEQLEEVQKLLRQLPEKDTRKTKQEAGEFLKEDFYKALSKGYSARELSAYLKENKQAISVNFIEDAVKPKSLNAVTKSKSKAKEVMVVPEKKSQTTYPINDGGFEIIPDKPDGEL